METDGENREDTEEEREKQMVAEKRQIETQWEHNTGSASEARRGVWQGKGGGRGRW